MDDKTRRERGPKWMISIILATALVIAIFPLPYAYYGLLRLMATGIFGWFAFSAWDKEATPMAILAGACVLVFNPFIPVYMLKEAWMVVDLGAAVIAVYLGRNLSAS